MRNARLVQALSELDTSATRKLANWLNLILESIEFSESHHGGSRIDFYLEPDGDPSGFFEIRGAFRVISECEAARFEPHGWYRYELYLNVHRSSTMLASDIQNGLVEPIRLNANDLKALIHTLDEMLKSLGAVELRHDEK